MHNSSIFVVASFIVHSLISGSSVSPFCALFNAGDKNIKVEASEERVGYENSKNCRFDLVEEGTRSAHATLELIGNELRIDGRSILNPLSLYVAGGMPREISADGTSHECYAPVRFFTMSRDEAGLVAQGEFTEKSKMAQLLTGNLQLQTSLATAVSCLRMAKETRTLLVIDLKAWLEDYKGAGWRRSLPVQRLSRIPMSFPMSLMTGSSPYVDLTEDQMLAEGWADICRIQ